MRSDQPSRTARKGALNVVMLGASPQARLLPEGCAEATERLLVASGAVAPTTANSPSGRPCRR